MNDLLNKSRTAGGAINQRRFVKFGASDYAVLQASSAADAYAGISLPIGGDSNTTAYESGQRVDIGIEGIYDLELGGTVTRGDFLTADANGKGIKVTAPGQRIGAIAEQSGVSGDYIQVRVIVGASSPLAGEPAGATFVIGAEAANVINVGVQLTDAEGTDLAVRTGVLAYLSDDANGDSIAATAPDGGWAIGTDGLLIPVVANKAAHLVSEADGDIDLDITHAAGALTVYLILVMPSGRLVASEAITFAS